ncbi:MAG: YidC/Oxa1 family membrane protein insertase [bacterium]|nr:YidC/Oxa1 family membrane protein insertase [bacterium]
MSYIVLIYHEVFYKPLLNGLLVLTSVLPWNDLGFSVILLTVILRLIMFPLTHKMIRTQRKMKEIEPELKKIQSEKKNKEEQGRAVMDLYKKHSINPFSGFVNILIQFPLLFAMYKVFWTGIPFKIGDIYGFLAIPAHINVMFLGLINLSVPNIFLAGLAAASQFLQVKLAMPPATTNAGGSGSAAGAKPDIGTMMQKQMLYMFPVLIFLIGFNLPAAVALYWTTMNVFAIVHEATVRNNAKNERRQQTTN